jgi:hypothetical protein
MRGLEANFRSGHRLPKVISLEVNIGNVYHCVDDENIDVNPGRLCAQRVWSEDRRDEQRELVQGLPNFLALCPEEFAFEGC